MGLRDNKMTKQGVRDLNHPKPKKQPVEIAPESPPVDPANLVAPLLPVAENHVALPVEP